MDIASPPARHFLALALLLCVAALHRPCAAAVDAAELVRAADAIRFPQEPFQVSVQVTTYEPGTDEKTYEYRVLQRGNDKSIVQTLAPASERGQIMLSRDGELWVFMPAVSQPIRLPMSQRLTGQVANGDLARANFAGDYAARHLRDDAIDGGTYHVLELTAARDNVTYSRVLYWVNAANNHPYKAEFYTLSGRLMKTALYQDFTDTGGTTRPLKTTFIDAVNDGERSVMRYEAFRLRELPTKIFTKQYLKKLR